MTPKQISLDAIYRAHAKESPTAAVDTEIFLEVAKEMRRRRTRRFFAPLTVAASVVLLVSGFNYWHSSSDESMPRNSNFGLSEGTAYFSLSTQTLDLIQARVIAADLAAEELR